VEPVAKQTGSFLPDRFDDVAPDVRYVGTHRRQQSSWSLFAPIGIALGLVVVLVLGGLWFLDRSNDNLALDEGDLPVVSGEAPPEEAPEVAPVEEETPNPVEDPTQIDTTDLTITVLNGTSSAGLAARAGSRLQALGWPEATATNADTSDVAQSVVAYENDEDLPIAWGIALALGLDLEAVVQTTAYPGVRITVVLGSDYVDTEST
jgi:hypothetical protein